MSSKKGSGAKSKSTSSRKHAAEVEVQQSFVSDASGVDVGQRRVLKDNAGFLRTCYYRYTLMTGVYMLDPMEQYFLHFFMILGAFFTLRYTYAFYVAMAGRA